jgi:hypothetical protein
VSNEKNDIKNFSAEDIARYWEGNMSAQEMHALEAAAMDDPFLADALEGYNAVQPATIPADVEELRARLTARTHDKKTVPLRGSNAKWWRVAAVLIFLGGASLLAYKLLLQPDQDKLAKQEAPAPAEAANTAPVLPRDTITAGTAGNGQRIVLPDSTKRSPQSYSFTTNKPGVKQEGNASAAAKTTASSPVPDLSAYKADTLQAGAIAELKEKVSNDSVLVAANDANRLNKALQGRVSGVTTQQPSPAITRAPNAEGNQAYYYNNFSGRVVDQQNNAIPYASVRVNNNQVAATNNEGIFQIRSADTVLDLSVNSVGYQPRNFTLRGNQPTQDVALERSNSKMSEVVVVSGAYRKKSSAKEKEEEKPSNLNTASMTAQPVSGWDAFNDYLEANRRVDDANKGLKGEVIVTFEVNKSGQLSDFGIEKSLSKWHDAEATRLVKEGPAWKLLRGKKARARVIVGF